MFITNVDRTARNINILMWHRRLQLIDHGASLYFHHAWGDNYLQRSRDAFPMIKDHVLLPSASALESADSYMSARLTHGVLRRIVGLIPGSWLLVDAPFSALEQHREAYFEYLTQ